MARNRLLNLKFVSTITGDEMISSTGGGQAVALKRVTGCQNNGRCEVLGSAKRAEKFGVPFEVKSKLNVFIKILLSLRAHSRNPSSWMVVVGDYLLYH